MCLPAARMMYERHGPFRAHAMLQRLVAAANADMSFKLVGPHANPDWLEELDGVTNWRRDGLHLYAGTVLAPDITIGDGLMVLPPGKLAVETLTMHVEGRPVTEIVDHPFLDPSMIVKAANGSDRVQCWMSIEGCRVRIVGVLAALELGTRP